MSFLMNDVIFFRMVRLAWSKRIVWNLFISWNDEKRVLIFNLELMFILFNVNILCCRLLTWRQWIILPRALCADLLSWKCVWRSHRDVAKALRLQWIIMRMLNGEMKGKGQRERYNCSKHAMCAQLKPFYLYWRRGSYFYRIFECFHVFEWGHLGYWFL